MPPSTKNVWHALSKSIAFCPASLACEGQSTDAYLVSARTLAFSSSHSQNVSSFRDCFRYLMRLIAIVRCAFSSSSKKVLDAAIRIVRTIDEMLFQRIVNKDNSALAKIDVLLVQHAVVDIILALSTFIVPHQASTPHHSVLNSLLPWYAF